MGLQDMQSLGSLGKAGTPALINWTDEKDKDGSVTGLAAFLIGAERYQYFSAIGWYWSCSEIPLHTLVSAHMARASFVDRDLTILFFSPSTP